MDPWILILAAWLPIAGIALALCLYESDENTQPAVVRGKINPNPADES